MPSIPKNFFHEYGLEIVLVVLLVFLTTVIVVMLISPSELGGQGQNFPVLEAFRRMKLLLPGGVVSGVWTESGRVLVQ